MTEDKACAHQIQKPNEAARALIRDYVLWLDRKKAAKRKTAARQNIGKQKNRPEVGRFVLLLRLYLITMYLAISNIRIKTSKFRSNSHPWITEGAVWCLLFRP